MVADHGRQNAGSGVRLGGGRSLAYMNFTGNPIANSGVTTDDVTAGSNAGCNAVIYVNGTTGTTLDHLLLDGTGSADMGINGTSVNGFTMTSTEIRKSRQPQDSGPVREPHRDERDHRREHPRQRNQHQAQRLHHEQHGHVDDHVHRHNRRELANRGRQP